METNDSFISDDGDDDDEAKTNLTFAVKKKKKVTVSRKRALGNSSFRNAASNSTMKINNRALAQALEQKKAELRAAEAMNRELREENHALLADVSQAKLVTEWTKQDIHERLRAVSCTMQLAVDQLVNAIDACTGGDFRKLSDALARAGTGAIDPAFAAASEVEKLPDFAPADATSHARPPSRILASSSEARDVDQTCMYDDCDVDDEDDGQDAASAIDPFQSAQPPNGIPYSNLSLIAEQSYLIPNQAEFSMLDPDLEFRHSSSQDRRNQVVFQQSSLDSPLVPESSKTQRVGQRTSRSRSRPAMVQCEPGGMSPGIGIYDVKVRRSRSQDRRNTIIFRPSPAYENEDDAEKTECTALRHSKGRLMPSAAKDRNVLPDANANGISRLNDSLRLFSGSGEKDETMVDETVTTTSDLAEQVNSYKDLVKNSEIKKDQCSLQFVDEPELCDGNASPPAPTGASARRVNATELVVAGGDRNTAKENIWISGPRSSDAEEPVFGGQFVTRDRIARTPVRTSSCCDEADGRRLADGGFQPNCGVASLFDSASFGPNLNESERDRSLTKRDIPTFVPIVSSPRASLRSPTKRKSAASGKKAEPRNRDFVKNAATAKIRSNAAETTAGKAAGNLDKGKHNLGAAAKADTAGKTAAENVRQSRRGTFVKATAETECAKTAEMEYAKTAEMECAKTAEMECADTKEDESVLIENSFKDPPLPGAQCDRKVVDSNGTQENRPNNATNENATIHMFEDMEQTEMCSTTIFVPTADEIQQLNVAKHTCPDAEDGVVLADSNAAAIGGSSEFGTSGEVADRRRTAVDVGNNRGASGVDDELVEQLSRTVKRRKINADKSKLPATCRAAKPKNKDSGFNVGKLQEYPLRNLLQDVGNVRNVQVKQPESFSDRSNPAPDVETQKRSAASKPRNASKMPDTCDKADVENNLDSRVPTVRKSPEHVPMAESTEPELNADRKVRSESMEMDRDSESQKLRNVELPTQGQRGNSEVNVADHSNTCSTNEGELPAGECAEETPLNDRKDVKAEDHGTDNARSKKTNSKKIVRGKEGGSTTDAATTTKAVGLRDKDLESNGGLPQSDGTDKGSAISKAKEQRSNVKVTLPKSQKKKPQPERPVSIGNVIEEMKVERRAHKRRAAQDEDGTQPKNSETKLQATPGPPPPSVADAAKDRQECGPSTSRNRKTLPDLLISRKARDSSILPKCSPNRNHRARNSNETAAKTIPAPKNRSATLSATAEQPKPRLSNNASPHQEPSDRRSRRAATHVNYKEPKMNKKLRQGDPFTSTIYDGSSHN